MFRAAGARKEPTMRISGTAIFMAVISTVAPGLAQPSISDKPLSPGELIRTVITRELSPDENQGWWMFEAEREEDGKKQTKEVVETREGTIERLIAIDGHPLTPEEQQRESERIERLVNEPGERQKQEENRKKDAQQCKELFTMISDAFLFSYAGRDGELIKIDFRPNPSFQPSSREGRVLHAMEGEILVHAKELRLAAISGRLTEDVKFGGGLLGYVAKDGTFSVRRTKIGSGKWEMTSMDVNMTGKALLLKTIGVQQREYRSNFRKTPDDLTLTGAASILTSYIALAAK